MDNSRKRTQFSGNTKRRKVNVKRPRKPAPTDKQDPTQETFFDFGQGESLFPNVSFSELFLGGAAFQSNEKHQNQDDFNETDVKTVPYNTFLDCMTTSNPISQDTVNIISMTPFVF